MQDIRKFTQTISLTKIYYLANYNNTNYTNYTNYANYTICMVLEVLKVDFLVKNLSIFQKRAYFFLQNAKSLISDFFFSKTQINLIKIKTIKTFLQKITVRSVQIISHVTELISKSFYKITVIKSTKTYFVK